MDQILEYSPILIEGTLTTIELTVLSAIVALTISFVVGLSRFSRYRLVRASAIIYLEFFRGTSAIVQLFFMYYVLPLMGVHFSPLMAGVIACGFNLGSYGSEVVRGAIQSVARGQHEAAVASLITISDLTFMAQIIRVQTAMTLEPFLIILVIYFIIASGLVRFTNFVGAKFSFGKDTAKSGGN